LGSFSFLTTSSYTTTTSIYKGNTSTFESFRFKFIKANSWWLVITTTRVIKIARFYKQKYS